MDREELRLLRERVEALSADLHIVQARLRSLERAAEQEQEEAHTQAHTPLTPQELPLPVMPPPLPPMKTVASPTAEAAPLFRPDPAPVPAAKPTSGPGPLQQLWRRIGPPEELTWEMALGTWWLPRIGITVLAVAVVWLLSLALGEIPSEWLPAVRLGLGAGVCVALLAVGKFLEKRAETYARVLIAGGIALSYLVTFATHYLPFTRIFDSPVPTLVLLAAIVAFWTAVAQWRQSWLLGLGVTLLGHFTVGLSTLTLPEPHPLAVAGLVALAAGSAFFLWRNGWVLIALAGVLGAYGNYCFWLFESPGSDTVAALVSAMGVLVTFFGCFSTADFFAPEAFRRARAGYTFRTMYAGLNTVGFVGLGALLVHGFAFAQPYDHLFYFAAGVVLLLLSAAYARLRDGDPLYHAYLTKGIVVATIGGVALFEGGRLLATFAVEGLALLILARRPGMIATRILALVSALATVLYGILLLQEGLPGFTLGETPWGGRITVGLTVLALLAMAEVYRRTDWALFSPRTAPFGNENNQLLWQLDLITESPNATPGTKVLGGLLLPYALAAAGAALLWAFVPQAAPMTWQAPVLAGGAALLLFGATALGAAPWGLAALVAAAAAVVRFVPLITASDPNGPAAITLALLAPSALACEWPLLGRREGLRLHQMRFMPYALYAALGFAGVLFCFDVFGELHEKEIAERLTVVFALIAWGATLFSLTLHRQAVGLVATAYFLLAGAMWWVYSMQVSSMQEETMPLPWHVILWSLIASFIAVERLFALRATGRLLRIYGAALLVMGSLLLLDYLYRPEDTVYIDVRMGLLAFGFLVYAAVTRRRTALVLGFLIGLWETGALLHAAYTDALGNGVLLAGFGVLILFWGSLERGHAWVAGRLRIPFMHDKARERLTPALTCIPVALLVIVLERLPAIGDAYLSIAWTLAAVASFGVSLLFGQRYYRYAGLALFGLVLGRVFLVDTARLEPVLRIAAGAVLGVVMLAVGYGYVYARQRGGGEKAK